MTPETSPPPPDETPELISIPSYVPDLFSEPDVKSTWHPPRSEAE